MAQNGSDVVEVLSKVLVSTVEKAVNEAKFDKSMLGVVTGVDGGTYTVSAFGGQYTIKSDQTYTIGQSIVVTALQGDMKRLVCSPGNIGTMSTINTSVKKVNDRLQTFIDEDFADTILRMDDMQDQIDGSFVSWFYDGEPTANNVPAKDWTTETAKQVHINDLYYDTTSGYSYKWMYVDGVYKWVRETNSGVQSALAAASKAQDTADGKRRTFYATPSPPYDLGDVWMQGADADILICVVEKTINESFSMTDWQKSCKYTDDTAAEKAQADVDALRKEYEETKGKVDNKVWMEDLNNTSNDFNIHFDGLNTSLRKEISNLQTNVSDIESDVSDLDKRVAQNEKDIRDRPTTLAVSNAISTASTNMNNVAANDATEKANAAKSDAVTESNQYTDEKIKSLEDKIIVLENALKALSEKVALYHPESEPDPDPDPENPTDPDEGNEEDGSE